MELQEVMELLKTEAVDWLFARTDPITFKWADGTLMGLNNRIAAMSIKSGIDQETISKVIHAEVSFQIALAFAPPKAKASGA